MKHSHVNLEKMNFEKVADINRSELLGTVEEQLSRVLRLIWLIREMPKVPTPPPTTP
jgi:hypothetical protein